MTFIELGGFFIASFVAAAVNAVAGGGTFLTFPMFILGGLSALQANIMSTIALWPGTLASVIGYRGELEVDRQTLKPFLIIGVLGGAAGAWLLLSTPETVFSALVPWLLLVATLIFTFGRHGVAFLKRHPLASGSALPALLGMAAIAVYGGYFGAGIGILTLAMLQMMGQTHIHKMNAMKTVLTSSINAVTAMIFAFSEHVIWPLAFVMIAGAVGGGYFGARASLKVSPRKVRFFISAVGFSMSAYFFWKGV